MAKKTPKKYRRIPRDLIITVIVLAVLVSWGAWTYYHSDSAVKHRQQAKLRDECFDQVKARYNIYMEQNGKKLPDGSYELPEREQQYLDNIRKEEYRRCSELFPVETRF